MKMRIRTRSLLFLATITVSLVAACGVSPAACSPSPASISPAIFDPRGSALDHWIGNFSSITQAFKNANISGTNVYYNTASTLGNVTNDIYINENDTQVYTTAGIKAFFAGWYNNYTTFDANMSNAITTLSSYDFTGISDTWTNRLWKETLTKEAFGIKAEIDGLTINETNFDDFLADLEANFASVDPLLFGLPGLSIGATFASATPEECFIVLNAWIVPRNTFWVAQYMYRVDNGVSNLTYFTIQDVVGHAIAVMTPAKSELDAPSTSSLTINYSLFVDASIDVLVDDKGVNVVWDNDDSIRSFIAALDAGRRPGNKLFTGDEVLYLVHFTRVTTTISGDASLHSTWRYNNGSDPVSLKAALRSITSKPYAAQVIGEAAGIPAPILRTMLHAADVDISGGQRVFTDCTFKMGQLKVNAFDFEWNLGSGLDLTKVDLWYAEHTMVGLFAYEDINNNGIQDIEVRGTAPFLYPASNESRYKYRISSVQGIDYMAPVLDADQLAFGINFTGIQGALVPFDISDDALLFNNSVSGAIPENVSSIAFKFKFGVNATSGEGKMKVDYNIGDFNNGMESGPDPALEGLSLSMVTLFDATRLQYGQRVVSTAQVQTSTGAQIDPASNRSRQAGRVRFASGSSLNDRVFQMDLDSIPYQIGGTDHTAFGQLIPVRMGYLVYGRSTPAGNSTLQEGMAITRVVMLYSVNFPTWNGQALVHDPTFSTFIPAEGGPRIWLYVGILLGGVAAVVIIVAVVRVRRKRASSYLGMPRQAPGGAKARPGTPRVDLLHSFFFCRIDPRENEGVSCTLMDPYDPASFSFFASLLMARVQEIDPPNARGTTVSKRLFDPAPGLPIGDLDRMLDSATILSGDKLVLNQGAGRAYVYAGKLVDGTPVEVLDVFTRFPTGSVWRVSLCSRAGLAKDAYPAIGDALSRLAASLAGIPASRRGKDALEAIIDANLPVGLAVPRRFAPGEVSSFLREVRQDERLTPVDLAEIEADLRVMDDATGRRVTMAFKASAARYDAASSDTGDANGSRR